MLHSSVPLAPPPHQKVHHTPSAPQESTGPDVPEPADQAMKALCPAAPPASDKVIPAHMQPLCIQLGVSNKYTSARLSAARRVHQPPMLLFCTCMQSASGGGVGVPLLQQVLQPRHFWALQEKPF